MAQDETVAVVQEETKREEDEVRILAFLCNWCSYAGADLAGVSRLQYPAQVLDVRVMCTGTISPYFVMKAFQEGMDGVIVAGCHIGDCHYLKGNYLTAKRFQYLREALEVFGIEKDRLRLEWVSAAEGEKFANLIRDFTQRINELGPSPLRKRREGVSAG
jgi:F420-non-reducing hydrogenase iron-sulfur subunit